MGLCPKDHEKFSTAPKTKRQKAQKAGKVSARKGDPVVDGPGHDSKIFGDVDDFLWPLQQDSSRSFLPFFFTLSFSLSLCYTCRGPGQPTIVRNKATLFYPIPSLMDN